MKVGIVSDLHLEFRDSVEWVRFADLINSSECDHVLIAGDTHPNKMVRDHFFSMIDKPHDVIMGNHDYYRSRSGASGGEWFDDFIETEWMVGGCLWSNFDNRNPMVELAVPGCISDFRLINNWYPERISIIYDDHSRKIFESDRKIVMTHFSPSRKSIEDRFRNDHAINPYFCNNMDERILDSDKKLWIHGHVHSRWEYMIGDCRVVANPLGYPGEISERFEVKVVDIGEWIAR